MEATKQGRKLGLWSLLLLLVLAIIAYLILAIFFARPVIKPIRLVNNFTASNPMGSLPWPTYGQSAIGTLDQGVIATYNKQTPLPMASTAKLITALCVLNKYPITNTSSSPVITLTQSDVNIYDSYAAQGGSVIAVVSGEKISEYQMLQGMLLPSANNLADSLAIWAFGSLANYQTYATQFVTSHGWASTHIGTDASGFNPTSTSTASDLINIGRTVLSNPVLKEIVGSKSVSNFPVVGTISNVNNLIGLENIIGIKTGNTTGDNGVYLSASNIPNDNITLLTAVMGGPTLWQAMNDSYKLIGAAQANFSVPSQLSRINSGATVAKYIVPWTKQVIDANSIGGASITVWNGQSVDVSIKLNDLREKTKQGSTVGQIRLYLPFIHGTIIGSVILNGNLSQPSKWWLITHPSYWINI